MSDQTGAYKRIPLGDVAANSPSSFVDGPFGSSMKSDEYVESGVRLIQLQNIGDGHWRDESKKYISPTKFQTLAKHGAVAGDIAIAKMADPIARACVVPGVEGQFIVVADCIRLTPNRSEFETSYIARAINSPETRREAEARSLGSTRIRINLSELKKVTIPAPSLPEQTAIARILDTLDTQIEKTQALIAKLKQVKEGLLHDLLTRGVDENGELRPSAEEAPGQFNAIKFGILPSTWAVIPLGDCAEIVSGITLSSKSQACNGILVPYLRVANVQDGHIDLTDLKYIRVSQADLQSLRLQSGDVLMNEGGDFDKLGRGAVWTGQVQDCIHQNHVFRVRTDSSRLHPDFLAAFAASQVGKRFFIRASKQSTNLASINSTQLKAMPVPAAPMAEQLIIVERIRSMSDVIQRHKCSLSVLLLSKFGLMDDLLTGRIRVTPLLSPSEQAPEMESR